MFNNNYLHNINFFTQQIFSANFILRGLIIFMIQYILTTIVVNIWKRNMEVNENLLIKLSALGLNAYEAKSYISLLELGSANGYLVAKHAGIPSSKVYQALASLNAKGFAESDGMEESSYVPADPSAILPTIKKNFAENIDGLLPYLEKIPGKTSPLKARKVSGEKAVLTLLSKVIDESKQKLLITAWPRELEKMKDKISSISEKCDVHILSYGYFDAGKASIYIHRRTDLVREEISGRRFLVASDSGQGMAVFYDDNGMAEGIWTSSPGMTKIFADHILHDISLNFLMSKIPDCNIYEEELTRLRSKLYL